MTQYIDQTFIVPCNLSKEWLKRLGFVEYYVKLMEIPVGVIEVKLGPTALKFYERWQYSKNKGNMPNEINRLGGHKNAEEENDFY